MRGRRSAARAALLWQFKRGCMLQNFFLLNGVRDQKSLETTVLEYHIL